LGDRSGLHEKSLGFAAGGLEKGTGNPAACVGWMPVDRFLESVRG